MPGRWGPLRGDRALVDPVGGGTPIREAVEGDGRQEDQDGDGPALQLSHGLSFLRRSLHERPKGRGVASGSGERHGVSIVLS